MVHFVWVLLYWFIIVSLLLLAFADLCFLWVGWLCLLLGLRSLYLG